MDFDVIKEIFSGRELTIDSNNTTAILSKYSLTQRPIDIPMRIANYLINSDHLIEDSGNFETGEVHYIYNRDRVKQLSSDDKIFKALKPILREVRLNKLVK